MADFSDEYGLISRETLQRTADAIRYACDVDDEIYPPQFPDYINRLLPMKRRVVVKEKLKGMGKIQGYSIVNVTNSTAGKIKVVVNTSLVGMGKLQGYSVVNANLITEAVEE